MKPHLTTKKKFYSMQAMQVKLSDLPQIADAPIDKKLK